MLFVMSGIFRLAIRNKCYSGENPCREIERYEEGGPRKRTIKNNEEEKRFLAELYKHDPMLGYIVEIDLRTGMRRGEVCCLRWEWMDFERGRQGYINLPATICKNKEGRSIPMFENTRELLIEWMGDEWKTDGPVFRADEGLHAKKRKNVSGNIDPVSVGIRVSRLCKRIGLQGVTLHTFRHTFATRCLDRGVHPFIVKKWMGHKTLAVTLDYSHIPFDVEENALAKLEENWHRPIS
jgi:integrase